MQLLSVCLLNTQDRYQIHFGHIVVVGYFYCDCKLWKSREQNTTWNCAELVQHMWDVPCLHKSRELPPWNYMGRHRCHLLYHSQNMDRGKCIHPYHTMVMCYDYEIATVCLSNSRLNYKTHEKKIHALLLLLLLWLLLRKKKRNKKVTKNSKARWAEVDQQACSKLLPCSTEAPQRVHLVFLMTKDPNHQQQYPEKLSLLCPAWYRLSHGLWMRSSLQVLGSSSYEVLGLLDFATIDTAIFFKNLHL